MHAGLTLFMSWSCRGLAKLFMSVKEGLMRRIFLVGCVALLLAGCGDKAKDLYETAQFEEKQFNKPNATKLYRQIVEQYPGSPYAGQAKSRLAELEKR